MPGIYIYICMFIYSCMYLSMYVYMYAYMYIRIDMIAKGIVWVVFTYIFMSMNVFI
jgi:hypothetical protein